MECRCNKGKIQKAHGKPARTDITGFHGCDYMNKENVDCRATSGIYLQWERAETEKLPYVEQGRYQAVSTGEHLLVPDLGLVLRSTEMDGVWINGPFRVNREKEENGKEGKLKEGDDSLDALSFRSGQVP
eukprot:sb/3475211/